jgi:polyhydroxyalkanoate synthesis regulator phasin
MNDKLKELVKQGLISKKDAKKYTDDPISRNGVRKKTQPIKWTYPPKKRVVRKVLNNKDLFVGHELDYMEKNSKTSIKNRDGVISPNDLDEYESMIEEKTKQEYKKWIKKSREKRKTPSDPARKIPNRQRVIPMIPSDDHIEPMTTSLNIDPRFFENDD